MTVLGFELPVFTVNGKIDFMNVVQLWFEFFVLEYHWDCWDLIDQFGSLLLFRISIHFKLFLVEKNLGPKFFDFSLEPDDFSFLISAFYSDFFELFSNFWIWIYRVVKRGWPLVCFFLDFIKNVARFEHFLAITCSKW